MSITNLNIFKSIANAIKQKFQFQKIVKEITHTFWCIHFIFHEVCLKLFLGINKTDNLH